MDDICEKAKTTAGGVAALAEAIGDITPQAISQWKRIPAGRAIDVERVTGISRYALRPDVFGSEPAKAAAE